MTKLLIGEEPTEPEIRFWLTRTTNGVMLEAKHSQDEHSQTLLEIKFHPPKARIELRTRDIHAEHLLLELGIKCGEGIVTEFLNKSDRCPS